MSLYDKRCDTTGEWLGEATFKECLYEEFPKAGGDLDIEYSTAILLTKKVYKVGDKIKFDLTERFYGLVTAVVKEDDDDEYYWVTIEEMPY